MILAALAILAVAEPALDGDAARGEVIAAVAGCASCHTIEGGEPYAGGYAIETDFGTFYGSNLTPDPTHGIGAWSSADFDEAMRRGVSPDGKPYWPAFPYTSFTRMTDRDLGDLWAYLQTLAPVAKADRPHDVDRPRWQLRFWRRFAFTDRGAATYDSTVPGERGAYLVDAVGHCPECHTPRGGLGGLKRKRGMVGNPAPPEPAPDITAAALGDWTRSDWDTFLQLGMLPDGDFVGGEMARITQEGTARLSEADRAAMAVFLSEGQ